MKPYPRCLFLILCVLMLPSFAMAQAKYATATASLDRSTLKPGDHATISIVLNVKEGYHAQSHTPFDPNYIACELNLDANPAFTPGEVVYPPGKDVTYEELGRLSVYTGKVTIQAPITVAASAPGEALKITGKVHFQACNDKQCFMPQDAPFAVDATIDAPPVVIAATQSTSQPVVAMAPFGSEPQGRRQANTPTVIASDASMSFMGAMGAALIAGLLFNIMPCVLPVLPLKAIGFYEVSQHNRAKSFVFGLVFSLGVISIFAVLALFVVVLKEIKWGELFTKGWFIWGMTGLLVVLAFGLLGGWTFSLPMGTYRLEPRHDTYTGNFFWGALTAILATPCTVYLLPAVVTWAIQRPTYEGVPAMLMVGVGMALPYLLLSAFPEVARRFPRSGPWPDLFKQMMGFMMLAAAMYFGAGRALEDESFWWLVTGVVAVAAFYMIARSVQLSKNALPIGITSTLAVIMLGGMLWWTAKMNGISLTFEPAISMASESSSTTQPSDSANVSADGSPWIAFSNDAFQKARASGKPVLVKFTANWCSTCQVIEGTVFRNQAVWNYLRQNHIVTIKGDLSRENPEASALLNQLDVSGGIPLTVIYPPGSDQPIKISGIYSTETLMKTLRSISSQR